MLPDRSLLLLTAYVDGELSSRQHRQVDRLLRRSPEARKLLRRLQGDTRRLQALSRPALPRDLSGEILQTIAERGCPARPKVQPRAGVPLWKGIASAAAILLVLGLVSYLYFASSTPAPHRPAVARAPDPLPPAPEKVPPPEL